MRSMKYFVIAALIAGITGLTAQSALEEKPKNSIKDVMKKAHKGKDKESDPLCKVVVTGKGTADQKKALLGLYEDLAKNKPPKGDEASWKTKTDALVAAAKDVVAGKEGGEKKLKDAIDCMGCHKAHRGD
jgi:hypothetical protein